MGGDTRASMPSGVPSGSRGRVLRARSASFGIDPRVPRLAVCPARPRIGDPWPAREECPLEGERIRRSVCSFASHGRKTRASEPLSRELYGQ